MSNKSSKLFQEASKIIPGGVNSPVRAFKSVGGEPFFTAKADGPYLYTVDDVKLIDFVGTWGPAIHGHNHPVIKQAILDALENGTSYGTPGPAEVEMAKLIIEKVPSIEKVRMCNSGTEATMSAIRLARGHTGRDKIIKFEGCYHGHVDSLLVKAGSGALTLGNPDSKGIPASFAKETIVIPYNDTAALDEVFSLHKDEIAAVIVEPYPANCGLILPKKGYLKYLREICSKSKTILIFDEVMTGFRLAAGGVQELESIKPDLTTLGKIIGGGLPVGAFGGKAEIMNSIAPLGPVYQAGTLSGNPLAMAAGIAALKMLEENNFYENLNAMGTSLKAALAEAAKEKGIALQIPQVGSMFCLFFNNKPVLNYNDAIASDGEPFKKIFHYALSNGVYLPPSPYETIFIGAKHKGMVMEQATEILTNAISSI